MKTWLLLVALAGAEVRSVRTDVSPLGGNAGWRVRSYTPRPSGTPAPLFSFASPTAYQGYPPYAGLPATDGCYAAASVTGTRGEALTFTRASTRFCPTDGTANEATGVMCTSGQVCVTSLSGARGISVFRAATNLALRSEEFDNAAWAYTGTGSVTANAVTAPDGATTADQITGASANSGVTQTIVTTTAAKHNISVWARCNTATCSPRLIMTGVGNSAGDATCTLSATTTWKRFSCLSPVAYGAGLTAVAVRVDLGTGDPTTYFWGAQLEASAPYATPYVKTTSAAAARNIDAASFNGVAVPNIMSMAATISLTPGYVDPSGYTAIVAARTSSADYVLLGRRAAGSTGGESYPGPKLSELAASSLTLDTRWWVYNSATTFGAGHGTTQYTTDTNATFTPAALNFSYDGSIPVNGAVISNVCLDSSPTRCR